MGRELSSTDVTSRLARDGISLSRDRLAKLADAVLGEVQRVESGQRRFTEEQYELLKAAALVRLEGVNVPLLQALVHSDEGPNGLWARLEALRAGLRKTA